MNSIPPEMQRCIDACLQCYQTCTASAMRHCLVQGGRHLEPEHFRLMMACAEMCRTSAHLMLLGAPQHRHNCADCAAICRECADSCAELDGMEECVKACRQCAEVCEQMSA